MAKKTDNRGIAAGNGPYAIFGGKQAHDRMMKNISKIDPEKRKKVEERHAANPHPKNTMGWYSHNSIQEHNDAEAEKAAKIGFKNLAHKEASRKK